MLINFSQNLLLTVNRILLSPKKHQSQKQISAMTSCSVNIYVKYYKRNSAIINYDLPQSFAIIS